MRLSCSRTSSVMLRTRQIGRVLAPLRKEPPARTASLFTGRVASDRALPGSFLGTRT